MEASAEAAALDSIPDERLHEALSSLPERYRRVVLLFDVEGFSYAEIAGIVGVPLGTVMSRLHRGRKAAGAEAVTSRRTTPCRLSPRHIRHPITAAQMSTPEIPATGYPRWAPAVTTCHPVQIIVGRMEATTLDRAATRSGDMRRPLSVAEEPTEAVQAIPLGPAGELAGGLVSGRYLLRSQLGRGSMGVVWLAQDQVLDRSVALKQVMLPDLMAEETGTTALAQARGEARAAARVDHPGVIRIHDLIEDDGLIWVVMELLSGRTLREALDVQGALPVSEVTRVGLCLLDALQAIHRAGVVHRDLKPANVYLCDGGRVVITDFGIARATNVEPITLSGGFIGSPAYVAPEQAHGGKVGPASDLFSLGSTLFAAVEGRRPFSKESILATLVAVLEDTPGPYLRAGPLRPVIEGLLAKEPERRLSAEAARAALEAVHSRVSHAQGDLPASLCA